MNRNLTKLNSLQGGAAGGVWTVKRRWTTDPKKKAEWSVDGRKKSEKEIRAFVGGLNIQTDNLCQFLPQDKVYEFSRMTPKDLLHRTVDAVGEEQLQSDHRRLQEWQSYVEEAEATAERKAQELREAVAAKDGLEGQVRSFNEKRALKDNIEVHRQRKEWALLDEYR